LLMRKREVVREARSWLKPANPPISVEGLYCILRKSAPGGCGRNLHYISKDHFSSRHRKRKEGRGGDAVLIARPQKERRIDQREGSKKKHPP